MEYYIICNKLNLKLIVICIYIFILKIKNLKYSSFIINQHNYDYKLKNLLCMNRNVCYQKLVS